MKNRTIIAKILAVVMLFGIIGVWHSPRLYAAETVDVMAGQPTTFNISVPRDITITSSSLSGDTHVAWINNDVLNILAPGDSHSQTFVVHAFLAGTDSNNDPWSETRTIFINVADAPPTTPVVQMTAPDRYVVMQPGVPTVVDVTLRNNSNHQARNVRISPIVSANFTVELVGAGSAFSLNANSQRNVQLRVTPHASLEAETANVPFNISFENNIGTVTRVEGNIVVRLEQPQTDEARVILAQFVTNPVEITAGSQFTLTTTLRNTSQTAAANVSLNLGGFTAGQLTAVGTTNMFVGTIGSGASRDVNFTLSSPSALETGSYSITLTLHHDDLERDEVVTYFVTIIGEDDVEETDRARLVVTNITRPAGTFDVGTQVPVSVTIENRGERAATNIRLTANPDNHIVPRLASIQTLPRLDVGSSHTFDFAFAATSASQSRFYNIGFEAAYDIGVNGEERAEFEQFTGFNVYNPDEEDEDDDEDPTRSVPRIIISDYSLSADPPIVMANSEFDLTLTLTNTHSSRAVSNIRVTWQVSGGMVGGGTPGSTPPTGATFTPVNSSNTFFIDNIPPQGSIQHNMRLFAIPDAAPGNHTITVAFEYEDAEGNPFDATEDIGINVRQMSRLEFPGINIQEFANIGMPVQVNFNVLNTGRATLYNLRVWIEGEGIDASGADEIFGNFASGDFNFFWGNFFPLEPGSTTVRVMASYDDAMGERHYETREFNMEIMGGFDMDMDGDFSFIGGPDFDFMGGFDMEGDGAWLASLPWLTIAGGAGVILLFAGGGVFLGLHLGKRRGRKGGFEADDFVSLKRLDSGDDDF